MFGLQYMHKMAQFFRVSVGYLMGYENKPYAGLSKEEVRQYDTENEEDFLKKREEQENELNGNDPSEKEIEEIIDFEDWQKTDQTTYFEFFKLNRMGDYLNKEQRQRILDVARVMFPNAEKGLYTEEITQRQKEEP